MRILITIAVLAILALGCPPEVEIEQVPAQTCEKPYFPE